jgi:hypothetical protein
MSGAIPPLPQYALMAWYSVKAQGTFLLSWLCSCAENCKPWAPTVSLWRMKMEQMLFNFLLVFVTVEVLLFSSCDRPVNWYPLPVYLANFAGPVRYPRPNSAALLVLVINRWLISHSLRGAFRNLHSVWVLLSETRGYGWFRRMCKSNVMK